MRKPNSYDKRPLSEQFGFHINIDNQLTEIICKTSLGLKKNAAIFIGRCLLEHAFYDKLMRHWIKTELGVDIPCVTEVMDKVCWGCEEDNEGLKSCQSAYKGIGLLFE